MLIHLNSLSNRGHFILGNVQGEIAFQNKKYSQTQSMKLFRFDDANVSYSFPITKNKKLQKNVQITKPYVSSPKSQTQ